MGNFPNWCKNFKAPNIKVYKTQVLTGLTGSLDRLGETPTSTTRLWPCTLALALTSGLLGDITASGVAVDGVGAIVSLILLLFLLNLDDAIAGVTCVISNTSDLMERFISFQKHITMTPS